MCFLCVPSDASRVTLHRKTPQLYTNAHLPWRKVRKREKEKRYICELLMNLLLL